MKIISQNKIKMITGLLTVVIILLMASPAQAEPGDIEIIFSNDPLFNEINTEPGDVTSETITVTNNTDTPRDVGIEFIGTSVFELDEVIMFTVWEDGNIIYGGPADPKSLGDLIDTGEITLSNLGPGLTTIYTFDTEFVKEAGNEYQLKTSVFDIKVGFIEEDIPPTNRNENINENINSNENLNTNKNLNENVNTPTNTNNTNGIILGEEDEELPPENGKILGIELPITGYELLTYSLLVIVLILVTVPIAIRAWKRPQIEKKDE
ncbi:MAG: hypothetical protein ABIB97_04410 [Patescibacteria group bacterium]